MPLTVEDMNIFQVKKDMAVMEKSIKIAKEMLKNGLPLEMISKCVEITIKELNKILKK